MALPDDCKVRVQEIVKDILVSRLDRFPSDAASNRNAPFHSAFLNAFRKQLSAVNIETPYLVALASWMHGLNTSLGNGFESIAHILSGGYKRKFTGQFTLQVSATQAASINSIVVGLKSGALLPNLKAEDDLVNVINENDVLVEALGFTADNYLETDTLIEAIELKSVRPNSGEGRGEKQKILFGKAAFKRQQPDKDIKFYIGFPFDPTSPTPTEYDKERFMNHLIEFKKFFSPDEILIASELWDHLSGQPNTMEELLEIVADTVQIFCSK